MPTFCGLEPLDDFGTSNLVCEGLGRRALSDTENEPQEGNRLNGQGHQSELLGPIIRVVAFVDWNSQIHLSGLDTKDDPVAAAKAALEKTARRVARCLIATDQRARFVVNLRLYHGWHRGFEPSANKKAITTVLAAIDFASLSAVPAVSFSEAVGYGDCLLAALPRRLHQRLAIHLPNTLRTQDRVDSEKMVDTALATDVVFTAFNEPNDWIVVVAEDDDLVPPMFTAEALLEPHGARVLLLHSRKRRGTFLRLDLLTVRQQ